MTIVHQTSLNSNFNYYKTANDICKDVTIGLVQANFLVINYEDIDNYPELVDNPELGLFCYVTATVDPKAYRFKIILRDFNNYKIAEYDGKGMLYKRALKEVLAPFKRLAYEFDKTSLNN